MADNIIEVKSVGELSGKNFFIPSYQRGYRWTGQQVKDLLDDIEEFRKNSNGVGFYCLQPLVVKECSESNDALKANLMPILSEKTGEENFRQTLIDTINRSSKWEVIDGQQRLTTLCILLTYLKEPPYEIEYETRDGSADFLKNILTILTKTKTEADKNIDYHHMRIVCEEIDSWFKDKEKDKEFDKQKLTETIYNRVKFIWYESVDENAIEVFTRLNIGKIKLTNAELIKALMLNRSNFAKDDSLTLRQQEIASQWDQIEYTLQDDAFWLFLHSEKYKPATRIDFIFDLICDNDPWEVYTVRNKKNTIDDSESEKKKRKIIGTDEYKTFRYFYEYFHQLDPNCLDPTSKNDEKLCIKLQNCWKEVVKYFQILQEWYNDSIYYHYVGYLLSLTEEHKELIKDLVKGWNGSNKAGFKECLKDKIKDKIKNYTNLKKQYQFKDTDNTNEAEDQDTSKKGHNEKGYPDKTKCKPILLLHNIQTIIKQNEGLIESSQYGLPVFYKFPFHLFKKEKWDVEHIDSNTINDLKKLDDQKKWLKEVLNCEMIKNEMSPLKDDINLFINQGTEDQFEDLKHSVYKKIESNQDSKGWDADEKNQIWNFCLLNASTNRSYGNAIFPVKRETIIDKEQGKTKDAEKKAGKKKKQNNVIAFIPPVTKNVFMKCYTTSDLQFSTWNRYDAEAYRKNIYETLKEFGVEDPDTN